MTWTTTIAFDKATGKPKMPYARVAGPDNNVDNITGGAQPVAPHDGAAYGDL